MLTVPEAARRIGRHPETVRRWIREGRLRSQKVGTQHLIDEDELEASVQRDDMLPIPERWRHFDSGRPIPNVVAAVRRSREGR